ncbi:hypothetical protein B0H14DRAFT_2775222, partial [Mycena olivaceomarginata]
MCASPPVFLFSLAFLYESTRSSCFHAYFFDVPLFFRRLQVRSKNANTVDQSSVSGGKEKRRIFIETLLDAGTRGG